MDANAAGLRFRKGFWAVVLLVLALLLALAFRPRAVVVEIGHVAQTALTVTVRDEGRTRVRDTYVVSAPLAGRLLRIGNRAGETVAAGEIVGTILPAESALLDERSMREAQAAVHTAQAALSAAQAERERAQAQQAHARAETERIESLFRREAVSQSALDRARLELRTADAALVGTDAAVAMREAELEASRVRAAQPTQMAGQHAPVAVRAPVGGRVLRVLVQSEAVVAAGTPIVELGDPRDLEVVAELLSSEAVQVAEGAEATIEGWGGPALRARVRLVEPYGFLKVSALGVEEQRVNVVIDLLDSPDE
jgi:HlyD family secretion protein